MTEYTPLDELTGLPERGHLWSVLDDVLIQIRRAKTHCGVLLIDIGNMDNIQKSIGEEGSEEYFKLIASRIKNSLWEMDTAIRFEKNQFVVVANSILKTEDIHVVMNKIIEYLALDCEVAGQNITPLISIGITLLPFDGSEVDEIIENTISALKTAKTNSENSYSYYNTDLGLKIESQEAIKQSILSTLADESFVLKLQPKINTKSGAVCGVETLVRMRDIDGVIVTPDEFIPIAENSNLILKIGDWVLEKAHKLGIEWQEKGIDVPISVNISDVQFKNGASLLSTLHKLVTESKGKSSNLTLEVSENVIAENVELAAALLFEIQSYGFRISIDGFGVGFSSLSVLSKLKVDEIKIDRHFLKDVPSDPKSTAILKSIIMLGKSMDFRVVVMGVETKAQSDILKKYECDEFQGFLISEPLDWDEFLGWLNNYNQSN